MSTTIRKNGKAYDSGDAVVTIDGVVTDEVKEISYSVEQEHQLNHGLGNNASSWSMGKISPKASVTLYMAAIVAIQKQNGGNLLAIRPFDIQVSFVNEYNEIVNDTITCKFQSDGRDVTGDMGLTKQFDLFAIGVQFLT